MLYLPPRYAHDGIAEGECQTYSVGFRAPRQGQLARDLLRQWCEAGWLHALKTTNAQAG
jgi:50S ribosomal protein L16 3-hydroxylase